MSRIYDPVQRKRSRGIDLLPVGDAGGELAGM
jgi:hypothetical protein